jgi:hypothetical protein
MFDSFFIKGNKKRQNHSSYGLQQKHSSFTRRLRIELLESRELLASHTWVGGYAGNAWNDSRNWQGGLPSGGDDIVFDSTSSFRDTINNSSISFNKITFKANDYSISGASTVQVSSSIIVESAATGTTIAAGIPGTPYITIGFHFFFGPGF